LLPLGVESVLPVAGVVGPEPEEPNNEAGRAINMTPINETKVPIFSIRVKGSLIRNEHAQHDNPGARKVMTTASAIGRYNNESAQSVYDGRRYWEARCGTYNTAEHQ